MVVRLLSEETDAHDERDRGRKRSAFVGLDDLVAGPFPAGQLPEPGLQCCVGKDGHRHHSTPARRARHTRGVPLDLPDAEAPTEVVLDRSAGLKLTWADGSHAEFG